MNKNQFLRKTGNFLFKDVSIAKNISAFVSLFTIIIFVKLFDIGFEKGLIESYFQIFVCGILILMFSFVIFERLTEMRGWGIIIFVIAFPALLETIYLDSFYSINIMGYLTGFFVGFNLIYLGVKKIKKAEKNEINQNKENKNGNNKR